MGQRRGSQGSLAQAWEWVWPSHRNLGRYIQSPFLGRDLEGVLGGVCEAVAISCTLLLCSLKRGQRDMQIPEETEAGDYRPGGWGG